MENNDIMAVIKKRKSVRTFDDRPLSEHDRATVQALMHEVTNPFGIEVRLHLVDEGAKKLGTMGVIRGARTFLGASADLSALAPLALGYQFESLILGLAASGIASVWLGGTFKKKDFARAMHIRSDEWFPVVAPIGYAARRPGTAEKMMRHVTHADERFEWRDLFTQDSFQVQLSEEAAGIYAKPLEALRWAPSSANNQPWRVVKRDNVFYFYETHKASLGQAEVLLKHVDLGIGIAHFHLTAQQMGLGGHFEQRPLSGVRIPEDTFYHISWVAE